jgi:hypothetical protein
MLILLIDQPKKTSVNEGLTGKQLTAANAADT